MKFVVTGGAGFIGSALVRHLILDQGHTVLNIDKMTYAANVNAVATVASDSRYHFAQLDILDSKQVEAQLDAFQPDGIFHLAAESHVDRSIENPDIFVETNVLGTQRLLSATRAHLKTRGSASDFRFVHVSTDEVFGELSADDEDLFTEETPYDPRSPYAASKAASDHLVRACVNTYGFPALITNCSNNYGPFQNDEKLIPLTISRALSHQPLPVYGDGKQIRDWLFVEDHVRGIYDVFRLGSVGRSYNIGGHSERKNIDVVTFICELLDKRMPLAHDAAVRNYADLISFVKDRPGHDFRYAIDATRMMNEIDWAPSVTFEQGIAQTVDWFMDQYLSAAGKIKE